MAIATISVNYSSTPDVTTGTSVNTSINPNILRSSLQGGTFYGSNFASVTARNSLVVSAGTVGINTVAPAPAAAMQVVGTLAASTLSGSGAGLLENTIPSASLQYDRVLDGWLFGN